MVLLSYLVITKAVKRQAILTAYVINLPTFDISHSVKLTAQILKYRYRCEVLMEVSQKERSRNETEVNVVKWQHKEGHLSLQTY